MNVKSFVTGIFENELRKFGMKLSNQEIQTLQDIFDFDAIELTINQDLESNTRLGKAIRNRKLSKHKMILSALTKNYAQLIYRKYSRTMMMTESSALESQALLKCNSDIYPCEKKGFGSAY
ncbi:hypothetical protein [Arcobacter sp.]|uniref:hypothetical protein n=1 Tax=unclassified Arcobacter TaxID=2593671 RepID=UPI003B00B07C